MQSVGAKRPRDDSSFAAAVCKSARLRDGADARWPGVCRTPQHSWAAPVRASVRVRTGGGAPRLTRLHTREHATRSQQPHGGTSAVAALLSASSPGPKFGGARSTLRRERVHAMQATPFRATPSGAQKRVTGLNERRANARAPPWCCLRRQLRGALHARRRAGHLGRVLPHGARHFAAAAARQPRARRRAANICQRVCAAAAAAAAAAAWRGRPRVWWQLSSWSAGGSARAARLGFG
jgi:hypothetical protein